MLPPGTGATPLRGTASPMDGLPSRGRLNGGTGSAVLVLPGSPRYAARWPAPLPVPAVVPPLPLLPLRGTAPPDVDPSDPDEPDGPRMVEPLPPPARAPPDPPRSPPLMREPPPPPPET